jgi:ribosomal protein L6P/L9E
MLPTYQKNQIVSSLVLFDGAERTIDNLKLIMKLLGLKGRVSVTNGTVEMKVTSDGYNGLHMVTLVSKEEMYKDDAWRRLIHFLVRAHFQNTVRGKTQGFRELMTASL